MLATKDQALPGLDGWTVAQSLEARAAGWDIFDCDGSDNGRVQLCRCDEAEVFEDDNAVWAHVWRLADEVPLYAAAQEFIRRHNSAEALLIGAYVGGLRYDQAEG